MIEPTSPVTIYARETYFPAVQLESDEWKLLKPGMVILRHRHLVQQRYLQQGILDKELQNAIDARSRWIPSEEENAVYPPRGPSRAPVSILGRASPVDDRASVLALAAPEAGPSRTTDVRSSKPSTSATSVVTQAKLPTSSQTAGPDSSQPAPAIASSSSAVPLERAYNSRQVRRIRGRVEKTSWFASSGCDPLEAPPPIPLVCLCDLYVHTWTGGRQVWIFDHSAQWLLVELGCRHPNLGSHRLSFCANGDPSWVTKETLRTYRGHAKKRERDNGKEISGGVIRAGEPYA